MTQAFFHDGQNTLASFGEDHPVRLQSDAGEAGGEKVSLSQHPQDGTIETRQYARGEQGSGGGMFCIRTSRGGFMQRA